MIKFEESSDYESNTSESEEPRTQLEFYDNDPELPLFSTMDHGYPVHLLIHTLLAGSVDEARICKVQPLGVTRNAMFQIDLDRVHFGDLKADDLGSWAATGTRRTHFRFTQTNTIRYSTGVPTTSNDYFLLTRRYFVHKTYNRFHRIISDIKGTYVLHGR